MAFTTLKLEIDGLLAILTLNRPDKRNAISPEMLVEIPAALGEIESSAARAAILTGAGSAFCAGMDLEALRELAAKSPAEHLEDSRRMAKMFLSVHRFPKPVIAAVNGAALAGGCGLATLCDFTLAAPDAKFGYTEVRIGFVPAIVSVFLSRQIGEKHTRDLLLSGRIIDAAEARELGLVNEIVAAERLAARARELAGTLLANSPGSLTHTKRLLLGYGAAGLERELEEAVRENAAMRSTQDFREGLAAFLEKRKPKWSGT